MIKQLKHRCYFSVRLLVAVAALVRADPVFGSGSASTEPIKIIPLSAPQLIGESVGIYRWNDTGIVGNIDPSHYYKKYVFTQIIGSSYFHKVVTYDPVTQSTSTVGSSGDWYEPVTTVSDTTQTWGHPGSDHGSKVKSDEFFGEAFKSFIETHVPSFEGFWGGDNSAYIIYIPLASYNQTYTPSIYGVSNLQYKWKVNAGSNSTVLWDVQYTPRDDIYNSFMPSGPIQHTLMSWTPNGSAESPVYTIKPLELNGKHNGTYDVVPLTMKLVVDANRDGWMDFDGDSTSQNKPCRFWVNDDDDRDEQDHPGSSVKDSTNNQIESQRDLEDFTRLHINIGGLQDAIAAGDIQVGLEWRDVASGTSPAIKIYIAAETDGGDQYLKSEIWAVNQSTGTAATSIGTISSGGSFKFPTSFWQEDIASGRPVLSFTNSSRYLIFEGSGEGKGRLVLTFWQGGQKVGDGAGVWLDLKDVKKMYERSYGKPRSGSAPWKKPSEYNPYQEPVVSIVRWTR